MTTATTTPSRTPKSADRVLADAVSTARAAAVEVAGEYVGDHVGFDEEGERALTHRFSCTNPGYRGWVWAVTLARAPRARSATVSEVVLLPDADAILAPAWLPWHERVRPGDLGPGDLLPTAPDDPRLAPAYTDVDDEFEAAEAFELGLGRVRVLSLVGRDDAAERWRGGEGGPDSAMARSAPGFCATCGWFVPLGGGLGLAFGACANPVATDDGQVVSVDHGCGAHSEAVDVPALLPEPAPALVDTVAYDVLAVADGDGPPRVRVVDEGDASEAGSDEEQPAERAAEAPAGPAEPALS